MTKATIPNEVREAMARAISRTEHDTLQVGGVGEGLAEYDPEAAFDCYIDHVDAALAALEAAGWEVNRKGTFDLLVEAGFALSVPKDVAREAHARWDGDMRAGKLLIAMQDPSLRYRAEITAFHETVAKINAALNAAFLAASPKENTDV